MKHIIFIPVFLISSLSFCLGQTNGQGTGSKFTSEQANEMLEYHNMARKELSIAPMTWNPTIAAYAQEWANFLA